MSPRVSVVVPAFNMAAYIAGTVQSAMRQTMSALELIVVDDGSTDQTVTVARAVAGDDPRVRVVPQPHGGVSRARNLAMTLASAPVFALLDSDDEWMPTFLETGLRVLDSRPEVSVVTNNAINRGGRLNGLPYWRETEGQRAISKLDIIEREDSVCIMSIFRRTVFERIGGFDERLMGNEDYDFWLRAAQAGFVFVQNLEPLGYYRRRPDSMSANEHEMLLGIASVLEKARGIERSSSGVAALDRQLARFERQRLAIEGKTALRNLEFEAAAERFDRLYERGGGAAWAMAAALSRHAPMPLLWFDRLRRALRAS
jgi:glycosyltransferase involved in cell wall biosynthesis